MKFNIENIIYILAIIIWVVVGFIKKNKKKEARPATTMPPVGETQQPDISDVLEKIFGEKPIGQKETRPEPVMVKKTEPKVKEFSAESLETITGTDSKQRSIKKENQSGKIHKERKTVFASKEKPENHSASGEEAEQNTTGINIPGQFDLRKAVVFSEILKRPYGN